MTSMVDRVAEAISRSFHEEGYIEGQSEPSLWAEFQKAAKEAIAAMREPTHLMLVRGSEQGNGPESYQKSKKGLPDIWRDMVDSALGEGE